MILFIIFYGLMVYLMVQRYQKTWKRAEETKMVEEKEMLINLAKKRKRHAILVIGYMSVIIIFFTFLFLLNN